MLWLGGRRSAGTAILVLCGWICGVMDNLLSTRLKPFITFVCHHKLGAAALARMLKSQLTLANPSTDVWLDSDNLEDMTDMSGWGLFDVVRCKVDTVVVLLSKMVLTRPWCIGETRQPLRGRGERRQRGGSSGEEQRSGWGCLTDRLAVDPGSVLLSC